MKYLETFGRVFILQCQWILNSSCFKFKRSFNVIDEIVDWKVEKNKDCLIVYKLCFSSQILLPINIWNKQMWPNSQWFCTCAERTVFPADHINSLQSLEISIDEILLYCPGQCHRILFPKGHLESKRVNFLSFCPLSFKDCGPQTICT